MMPSEELAAVLSQTKNVKRNGDGHTGKCPAHEDNRSSLSIGTGRDGRLLLTCHAGCTFEDVLAKYDLPRKKPSTPTQEIVYPYTDPSGNVLYEVVRRLPKDFRQRRPNADGSYVWNLGDVRRVLYRLPEIIEAVALERTIYIVEGEKDVATLCALGLDATTTAGGAGKWRTEYNETLRGAEVVILPDNDPPGKEYAKSITTALAGIAKSVRTIELSGLPEKGDVSDWVQRGGTVAQLQQLLEPPAVAENLDPPQIVPRIELFDDEEIQNIPEPEWLVPGIIPGSSLVQLFGPSESYKTFAALDLACHIATGMDWHGRQIVRGNVVYVMAEGIHGAKHRMSAWKSYHGVTGKLGLYFVRHRIEVVPSSEDVIALLEVIATRLPEPPVLIVIDTLARNMKGNENATEDMNVFTGGCDSLKRATGATVLTVHHNGLTETDRGRGNSSNRAALDTEIQSVRDGDRITLICRKQKDAPHFGELSFEAMMVGKSLVLKPMDQGGGNLDGNRLACLRAVHASEGGLTHGQWRKEAGLENKRSSFSAAVKWLEGRAYVKKGGEKKYIPTDAGVMALGPRSTAGPPIVQTSESELVHRAGVCTYPAMDLDQSTDLTSLPGKRSGCPATRGAM